ncbi:uncharacterized protein PRCAT00004444001 [Priceomyces carsonii]|uniref:uncharacterized protein n=1 Tax=Priceomyces carsonii TaxID=28549 RepID=UPI002ED9DCAA|nr:unnamed protein product [Priceomyces carsonii]
MFSTFKLPLVPQLVRTFKLSVPRSIAAGEKLPSVSLFKGSPGNDVNIAKEIGNSKAVIIGVPGAFSPACSASHVPGYIKALRAFNDKGYKKFFVIAVNDPFVTKAWADDLLQKSVSDDQIQFLADPRGEFTSDLDLLFDASKIFGNKRSKRYALLVDNGKVTKTFIEPDNTSVDVSDASKVLKDA